MASKPMEVQEALALGAEALGLVIQQAINAGVLGLRARGRRHLLTDAERAQVAKLDRFLAARLVLIDERARQREGHVRSHQRKAAA